MQPFWTNLYYLLQILRLKFLRSFQYRAEIITWILIDFLPFFILFFVWSSIYQGATTLRGNTLSQTILYYLLAYLIEGITSCHFENWRSEEIREGKIDHFMVKPFSYITEIIVSDLAGKLFYLFFFLPFFALLTWFTLQVFKLSLPALSIGPVLTFIALLITAYSIELAVSIIITLLTFWYEGANGLEHFKWLIFTLFTGTILPFNFMPAWLKTITLASPLKYTYFIPIQVVQGLYQMALQDWLIIAGLILGFWLIVFFTWQRAVAVYTSAGG